MDIETETGAQPCYRYCIVPMCENNTTSVPGKLYFHVPRQPDKLRNKWCEVMGRMTLAPTTAAYCCEDHFNIEEDTDNFMEYRIMGLDLGNKFRLRLKKGVIPHIFECQTRQKQTPPTERLDNLKRGREAIVDALSKQSKLQRFETVSGMLPSEFSPTDCKAGFSISEASNTLTVDDKVECEPSASILSTNLPSKRIVQVDKAVQVKFKVHFRSKGINVDLTTVKNSSIASSPVNIPSETTSNASLKLSTAKRKLLINTADITSTSSKSKTLSKDYDLDCSTSKSSSSHTQDDSESEEEVKNLIHTGMLAAINREPQLLLGLPKKSFNLVKFMSETIPLPTTDILITLKKIKLNESFEILALHFGYSQTTISKIFSKSVPLIADKLKKLIVWPTPDEIFRKLPKPFRTGLSKVVSIIDCFEIQIKKPSKSEHQYLTWSESKGCNTLKYLISYTPDGLVSYVSNGHGGRSTDTKIVEDCGYLNHLPYNKAVMADTGFKGLSKLLKKKNCTLVQPSLSKSSQPKDEIGTSEQIAALRIHIKRVTSRLRDFHMLLPHVCVNHNLISLIDDVIVIACGLINLQNDK